MLPIETKKVWYFLDFDPIELIIPNKPNVAIIGDLCMLWRAKVSL
jgi:hypothetical protein